MHPRCRSPACGPPFLGDFIIGFAVAGIIIPSQTMIQQETPPALMGRVGATTMSMIFTAQISGLVLSGILAEHIGVRHVFALCAVLLVIAHRGRIRLAGPGGFHPSRVPLLPHSFLAR